MATAPQEPFLTADLGEYVGTQTWETFNDFETWIQALQSDWVWIISVSEFSRTGSALDSKINGWAKHLLDSLRSAENSRAINNTDQFAQYIAKGKEAVERFANEMPWLLEGSPQRQFVFRVKDQGREHSELEALAILCEWFNFPIGEITSPKEPRKALPIARAMTQLELFEQGLIPEGAEKVRVELTNLTIKLKEQYTNLEKLESAQVMRFEALAGFAANQASTQQSSFDDTQKSRQGEWSDLLENAKKELAQIKATYDEQMALQAPVEYWQAKQKSHRSAMDLWGVVFLVFVATSIFFLYSAFNSFGSAPAVNKPESPVAAASSASPNPSQTVASSAVIAASSSVAVTSANPVSSITQAIDLKTTSRFGWLLILVTLFFWGGRILVRIFLSHLHLENDAAERVTMAKTYLALFKEGRLGEKPDASIVLGALFRPSGDGIVKEESMSPMLFELLSKQSK